MICRLIAALGVLCVIQSSVCAQEQASGKRFLKWLTHDPVSFVNDFGANHLVTLGFSGVVFTTLSDFDERMSNQFRRRYNGNAYLDATNEFGTVRIMAPLAAAVFGTSLLSKDKHFQDAAFTSFQAVLYNQLSVGALKYAFARSRPYENDGSLNFNFFSSNGTSFPSGHTSTAFAVITPWIVYYPNVFTYSLLAVPAGTALARIAKGRHWLTDVTFGAAIGAYWGYYLSTKHLSLTKNTRFRFEPDVTFQSVGAKLHVSL